MWKSTPDNRQLNQFCVVKTKTARANKSYMNMAIDWYVVHYWEQVLSIIYSYVCERSQGHFELGCNFKYTFEASTAQKHPYLVSIFNKVTYKLRIVLNILYSLIMGMLIVFVYFLCLWWMQFALAIDVEYAMQIVLETSSSHIINLLFDTNIAYALMLNIFTYVHLLIWLLSRYHVL